MTSKPLLRLDRVQALHPRAGTPIHQPITFSLSDGEIGILFGENGAGKSSLLDRIVFGERAFAGNIIVDRQKIAYLPQLTIGEFQLPLRLDELSLWNGISSTEPSRRLWNSASGGEKQMALLEIVLAQHSGCGLLVLDEPTNHLDPAAKTEIEKRVLKWLNEATGRSVIAVSHDPNLFVTQRKLTVEVARA